MQHTWNIDSLQHMWHLATRLHGTQTYGGQLEGEQIPYMNHIGSVVFEVLNAIPHDSSIDADLAIACAILHDTLEDTEADYEAIKTLFGQAVADGVAALTKNSALPKQEQMMDSLLRIKAQPKAVWLVKMADRVCNLYAPPHYWNETKKRSYQAEARIIHEQLHAGNAYMAARLHEKIDMYQRYF